MVTYIGYMETRKEGIKGLLHIDERKQIQPIMKNIWTQL